MILFFERLKENLIEGILLLIKYGLLIIAIIYAYNFSLRTRQMAYNGEQAAVMLIELQKKGWIPKLVNGEVPQK